MNYANVEKSPRLQRALRVLRSGGWHSTRALMRAADICAVNSVVAELRANGFAIDTRCTGRGRYEYQLNLRSEIRDQGSGTGGIMPAYNFQKRFARLVESGEKTTTIRRLRKHGNAMVGRTLQLYAGQRTPACRKLVDPDPVCTAVSAIVIHSEARMVSLRGRLLRGHALADLARADGFDDLMEFFEFFRRPDGSPYHGIWIKWRLPQ